MLQKASLQFSFRSQTALNPKIHWGNFKIAKDGLEASCLGFINFFGQPFVDFSVLVLKFLSKQNKFLSSS